MTTLEVSQCTDERTGEPVQMFRAVIIDIDDTAERPYHSVVTVVEDETAEAACYWAIEQAESSGYDVTHAKHGERIEAPDAITVSEAARAMAGVW